MKRILRVILMLAIGILMLLPVAVAGAEERGEYTVSYYDGTELLFSTRAVAGEAADKPADPERVGYDFCGWSLSPSGGELYDMTGGVTSDLELYATYKLTPPTFNLADFSFVYDGDMHFLILDEIEHPLLSEGLLGFEWYKDGVPLSKFGDRVGIKNVSESGRYKCKITFSVASDSVTVFTPEVDVFVSRATVSIPEIPSAAYTGNVIYPEIYSSGRYTVERTGAVEAGIYPITIMLVDSENYKFDNSDYPSVTVDFEIKRAENSWREPPSVSDAFLGEPVRVNAIAAFGEAVYKFSTAVDGIYTEDEPAEAGTYYVKAFVSETGNYTALESEPIEFSVIGEWVLGIAVTGEPHKTSYVAFEKFDPTGLTVGVSYNSGRQETVGADKLSFSYLCSDSFRYGDSGVIISYLGASTLLKVDVKKAEYDLSGIIFEDGVAVYDGKAKIAEFSGVLPIGDDGIALTAAVSGGGVNVGKYICTLNFSTESENYVIPTPITAAITVTPCPREVIWGECTFTYDGLQKAPRAHFIDIFGRKIALSVEGAKSYAGSYVATAACNDPNYILSANETDFVIKKARYDMSDIVWSEQSFVYDGAEKRVVIASGLPTGVSVIGYANNKATDSGSYSATVSFGYDEDNYEPPEYGGYKWIIHKAEYSVTDFHVSDSAVIYDGNIHYPTVEGIIEAGADGSVPTYSFSCGVQNVSEGEVTVRVDFFTESKNYNPPLPMYAKVKILPIPITVVWSDLEFTYDGEEKAPSAIADEREIIVTGGMINAGDYIATATSADPNYEVENAACEFRIKRAENAWVTYPTVGNIYLGGVPTPDAAALEGVVKYLYFEDEKCTLPVNKPSKVGIYYMKAVTEENINYESITSDAVSFEVLAILPVELLVEISRGELFAFEKISPSDFSAFVLNNDGTKIPLDSHDVSIGYPEGDSLRAGECEITFYVGGFSVNIPISVAKSRYDMSEVRWEGTEYVYNGKPRSAYVVGLPFGVEIVEYIGNGVVNAGQYEVLARLSYDNANFEEPEISPCTLVIKRCPVPIPEIESLVYTGVAQKPSLAETALYSFVLDEIPTKVGKYTVTLKIRDTGNYTFVGGEDSAVVEYSVVRRPVRIKISDVDLYIFEDEIRPTLQIVDGSVLESDFLVPSFHVKGDMIYADFSDPSYDITVIPGRIYRHNSFSPTMTATLIIAFMLFILFLTAVLILYRNGVRIYRYYRGAVLRSSRHIIGRKPPIFLEAPKISSPERRVSLRDETGEIELPPSAMAIDAEYADSAISNALARNLIRRDAVVITSGWRRRAINVDVLSENFAPGDRVDVNTLKEKNLIPRDVAYIKILARGTIDKPLNVYANDFSLAAVKMIALSGGRAIKATTAREPKRKTGDKNGEST